MKKIAVGALILLGCSSSTESATPAFQCKIGELDGTWRVTYAETDGNCGQLAAETVVLKPGATSSSAAACQTAAQDISADKCRIDLDYTCPLATGSGSQHWAGAMHQTAETKLEGSLTVQANGSGLNCRSTYDVTWQRQ